MQARKPDGRAARPQAPHLQDLLNDAGDDAVHGQQRPAPLWPRRVQHAARALHAVRLAGAGGAIGEESRVADAAANKVVDLRRHEGVVESLLLD